MPSLHFHKRWALIRIAALVLLYHLIVAQCEDAEDFDEVNQTVIEEGNTTLSEDTLHNSIFESRAANVSCNGSCQLESTKDMKDTNATKCATVCHYPTSKLRFLSVALCSSSGLFIYPVCSNEVTCRIGDIHDLCIEQPPKEAEYRRPKCEEETGCDIPLRCFNFSSLGNDSIVPQPPSVVQVDAYQLQDILENSTIENCCALVMYYAPWCAFSTNFAPKFNALGRSFHELPTLALNYGEHNPNKYVLAYLPVIALYHKGRIVFRFRLSSTYEELIDIVARMTGFIPSHLNFTESELLQPVPTQRVDDNVALYLALSWIAFVAAIFALRSNAVAAFINHLKSRLGRNRTQEEKAE